MRLWRIDVTESHFLGDIICPLGDRDIMHILVLIGERDACDESLQICERLTRPCCKLSEYCDELSGAAMGHYNDVTNDS